MQNATIGVAQPVYMNRGASGRTRRTFSEKQHECNGMFVDECVI